MGNFHKPMDDTPMDSKGCEGNTQVGQMIETHIRLGKVKESYT